MKVDIIKKTEFVARDSNGKDHPLLNFHQSKYECIEHSNVRGKLLIKYDEDSFHEVVSTAYFKIFSPTQQEIEYKCSEDEYTEFYKSYLKKLREEVKEAENILNNKTEKK